jgi:hypothetical protein
MRHAVVFDRDGVINSLVDRGAEFERRNGTRLTSPWHFSEFEIFIEVRDIVSAVKSRGYLTIVATNQPGIANLEMRPEELEKMHEAVRALGIDDIRTCPHNDADACGAGNPSQAYSSKLPRIGKLAFPLHSSWATQNPTSLLRRRRVAPECFSGDRTIARCRRRLYFRIFRRFSGFSPGYDYD